MIELPASWEGDCPRASSCISPLRTLAVGWLVIMQPSSTPEKALVSTAHYIPYGIEESPSLHSCFLLQKRALAVHHSFGVLAEEVMMSKQSAALEASGKGTKRNSISSGLMAQGRCVRPGCRGFGAGRMHIQSYALC